MGNPNAHGPPLIPIMLEKGFPCFSHQYQKEKKTWTNDVADGLAVSQLHEHWSTRSSPFFQAVTQHRRGYKKQLAPGKILNKQVAKHSSQNLRFCDPRPGGLLMCRMPTRPHLKLWPLLLLLWCLPASFLSLEAHSAQLPMPIPSQLGNSIHQTSNHPLNFVDTRCRWSLPKSDSPKKSWIYRTQKMVIYGT